jgi:hypothetical protein
VRPQVEARAAAQLKEAIAALREELMGDRASEPTASPAPSARQSETRGHRSPTADDHAAPHSSTVSSTVVAPLKMAEGITPPPGYQPLTLLNAVRSGEVGTVSKWLAAGVDPNAASELLAGWTPLHYAAQLGHADIVRALLDHGAAPQPFDRFEQTPLMQAGYWGRAEAVGALKQATSGVSRVPPLLVADDTAKLGEWQSDWRSAGHVIILCSAPEFSLPDASGVVDHVMAALEGICEMHQLQVKFGYDWGGSSTAEPADRDPHRRVPECCLSLACTCDVYKSPVLVTGPVDWSSPLSGAGSQWFAK